MPETIDFNLIREGQKEEVKRGHRRTAQEIHAKHKAKEKALRERKRAMTLEAWEAEDQGRPFIHQDERLTKEEREVIERNRKLRRERMAKTVNDAQNNVHAQYEAERLETLKGRNKESYELITREVSALEDRMNKKLDLILEKLNNASK